MSWGTGRLPAADRLLRYAISDFDRWPGSDGAAYLKMLATSGADIVQWRERGVQRGLQKQWLLDCLPVARSRRVPVLVNSDLDLALETGADGVHYKSGQIGDSARHTHLLVGRSIHSIEEGRRAVELGCDYVLLSPLRPPRSKPSQRPPLGVDGMVEAVRALEVPVFALGGVSERDWTELEGLGLAGLAGISWVGNP